MATTKIRTEQIKAPAGTTGDIFYRDADGNLIALPASDIGKVVVSTGTGTAPSYSTIVFDEVLVNMGLQGWK